MVGTKTKSKVKSDSFFADIIAAIDYSDKPTEPKDESLTKTLNRMITKGVCFETSIDNFQIVGADNLTDADKAFLMRNSAEILCTLQQSLLAKHLFNSSPTNLEDFTFDVTEREAIMTDGADIYFEIHCEAVKDVSQDWFARLLDRNNLEELRD